MSTEHRKAYQREYMRKYIAANREKVNALKRARYDPKKAKEDKRRTYDPARNRDAMLRQKYGISGVVFDEMLKAQNGTCAICEGGVNGLHPRFHVDHDHKTGKIRGLLCSKCNNGLGCFRDSVKVLDSAKLYLGKHTASSK